MNILVVPDGFKDSLSSLQVGEAITAGIKTVNPNINTTSIYASDGGDGFLNAVKHYKPELELVQNVSVDPLGRNIVAGYLYDSNSQTAYLELAAASGIELLKEAERLVMETSTVGTGMQIQEAIARGAQQIFIGLGGSATNDAAIGLASVLGFQFLDAEGNKLKPCGKNLAKINRIKTSESLPENLSIIAVNDVQNPLFGPTGAAYTYAKQKGASPKDIQELDAGLKHLDQIVQQELGIAAANTEGAGAAGGTAYGLKVFFNASFVSGTKFILGLSDFYQVLESNTVDFIITGEGCIDHQTAHGKLIQGLILEGKQRNIPVLAVCGKLNLSSEGVSVLGLSAAKEIYSPDKPKGYSYTHAAALIQQKTVELLKENS